MLKISASKSEIIPDHKIRFWQLRILINQRKISGFSNVWNFTNTEILESWYQNWLRYRYHVKSRVLDPLKQNSATKKDDRHATNADENYGTIVAKCAPYKALAVSSWNLYLTVSRFKLIRKRFQITISSTIINPTPNKKIINRWSDYTKQARYLAHDPSGLVNYKITISSKI